MLHLARKIKGNILPFPKDRVTPACGEFVQSAQIYILPSIRIERHSDHPEMMPKLKRKRA